MACTDCAASRQTNGLWRLFDPRCLFCGARLIQAIGRLPIAENSAKARRKAVLSDWVALGHAAAEMRALARLTEWAWEPVAEAKGRK